MTPARPARAPRLDAGRAAARAILIAAPFSALTMGVYLFLAWKAVDLGEWLAVVGSVALAHAPLLLVAHGLARGRGWARRAGIALALAVAVLFPVGTLLGGYLLFLLVLRWDDDPAQDAA